MNTKQMEYAIEVSHTLNFRKAAENLFISQPALTYQIQTLEEELGFELFVRTGKGVIMTPAGEQFCKSLSGIHHDLKSAIEDGRRFYARYKQSINIALPMRSAIYYLPQIMTDFAKEYADVAVQVYYVYGTERIDDLLREQLDLTFGLAQDFSHLSNIKTYHLYDSHVYLITKKDDPLAKLDLVYPSDLAGRTLMVGGGSPYELQKAQQSVIDTVPVTTINSRDHLTTLTNVAAGLGVCLSPGFCNDHLGEFKWTPFAFEETMNCVFVMRKDDRRQILQRFIEITQDYFKKAKVPL